MRRLSFGLVLSLLCLAVDGFFMSTCRAQSFAVGGGVGGDFPLSFSRHTSPGVAAEAFFRTDPYEIRFHYSATDLETYSVQAAVKHFFSNEVARPYVEAAVGPLIVDDAPRDLAYGVKPEVSLGLDLGINSFLSVGVVTRYFAWVYFGDTYNGNMAANHGFHLGTQFMFWF